MIRKRDDYVVQPRNTGFVDDELAKIVSEAFIFSDNSFAHAIAHHSFPDPEPVEKIVFSLEHLLSERKQSSPDLALMEETGWNLVPFVHHVPIEEFAVTKSLFDAQLFISQLQKK